MNTSAGEKIAVLNLSGRIFMQPLDCPFQAAKKEVPALKEQTKVIIVAFHAEATSEKSAMGWYLDGDVSAIIGSQTHVQTADEKIPPQGTAYITDVGMTGSFDSVIGIKKEQALRRFLTQMHVPFTPADHDKQLQGAVIEIDKATGRSLQIQRDQRTVAAHH